MSAGRRILPFLLALGAATAHAATVSIVPDKTTYELGETVTVEIVGDPQGSSALGVFARIVFDSAVLANGTVSPVSVTSLSGLITWTQGQVPCGSGYCDVLNLIAGTSPVPPDPITNNVWATVTLTASGLGTTALDFETAPLGNHLAFFGLTSSPGTSITVVQPVPSLGPLGIGVLAALVLAVGAHGIRARRRREALR